MPQNQTISDDVARSMIEHHIRDCDTRMKRIEGMFRDGNAQRDGLRKRIDTLIWAILGVVLGAFAFEYHQSEALKSAAVASIRDHVTQSGDQ